MDIIKELEEIISKYKNTNGYKLTKTCDVLSEAQGEDKKYELSDETIEVDNITLYRIRALKNFSDVRKGDMGGYVECYNNLSQKGGCWVCNNAQVFGNAEIYYNARVYDNAKVYGNAEVYHNAKVYGNAEVYDDAEVYENAQVLGHAKVCGDAEVYEYSKICGRVKIFGDFNE